MTNIECLAEVKKGRQRLQIMKHMDEEKPLIVSEIQKAANESIRRSKDGKEIRLSDVSRTLKKLGELGMVKCLNPRKKVGEKGILYQLTPKGKKIKQLL